MALKIVREDRNEGTSVLLHYGGSGLSARDATGPISMVGSGGLLYFPSNSSIINHVFNPSFEVDAATWTPGAATVVASSEAASSGAKSGKVTITNVASTPFIYNPQPYRAPCFGGDVLRLQLKAKGNASTLNIPVRAQLRFYDAFGVAVGAVYMPSTHILTTQNFQTLTIGPTTAPTNAVCVEVLIRFEVGGSFGATSRYAQVGDVIYIDDIFMTMNQALPTTYFDPTTKGVWASPISGALGTAHLSRSFSNPSVLLQEASVNLLQNPSAEVNASTGVITIGSTVTRDTNFAMGRSASFKCVTANAATSEGFHLTSATLTRVNVTQTFPARAFVYGESGTIGVFTRIQYTDLTQTDGATTSLTLDGTLKEVLLAIPTSVNTKTIDYVALCFRTSTQQAATFWVDMAQIEDNESFHSAYISGELGSGYTWNGAADLSSSTRGTAVVSTPIANHLDPRIGSAVLWTNRKVDTNIMQYMLSIGDYNVASQDWLALGVNNANDFPTVFFRPGTGSTVNATKSVAATVGTWQLWYIEWDGTNVGISLNGGAVTSVAKGTTFITFGATNIHVGSFGGTTQFNGLVHGLRVFNRKLSTSELTEMYNNPSEGSFYSVPITSVSLLRED